MFVTIVTLRPCSLNIKSILLTRFLVPRGFTIRDPNCIGPVFQKPGQFHFSDTFDPKRDSWQVYSPSRVLKEVGQSVIRHLYILALV